MANYHFRAVRPVEDLLLSAEHKLPGRVAQYLRDFQLDGIRFLYKHFENKDSCILNDESGLGKTVTICAFLETVLPHDSTRNCLIIVKNDERLKSWKFHLEVLTKLTNKVVFREEDISGAIVFLTKWESLQKSASIANFNFDCVIIDSRGELLANKICSGYFIRNYTSKISLIISSADVAIDLKQFHIMLKLVGRLEKKYESIRDFEDNFALPALAGISEDANLLEAYFLRREKIINFCREFRLRRYRHQYEDMLPLVRPEDYMKSLNIWITSPQSSSKSSSSSVKILSSSSEKDAEQLLKSYFCDREYNEISDKVVNYTRKIDSTRELLGFKEEDEDMPPLLIESDSEDRQTDRLMQSLRPKQFERDPNLEIANGIPKERDHTQIMNTIMTRSKAKAKTEKLCKDSTKCYRKKHKTPTNYATRINMRSLHTTRSKIKKSKYLLFEANGDYDKKIGRVRKKVKAEKKTVNNFEKLNRDTKYVTRSRVTKLPFKIIDDPEKINKIKFDRNIFAINDSDFRGKKKSLHKKGTNNNKSEKINSKDRKEDKKQIAKVTGKFKRLKTSTESVLKKNPLKSQPELSNCENKDTCGDCELTKLDEDRLQDDTIVLSSSTDGTMNLSLNSSINSLQKTNKFMPSPDIFSNVPYECDILCSQKDRSHNKIEPSIRKYDTTILKSRNSSCLDLLENEFYKEKMSVQETNQIIEISTSESFCRHFLHISGDTNEVTPVKSRTTPFQKNKITKYLIGSETSQSNTLAQQNNQSVYDRNLETCQKTPKKSSSTAQRTVTVSKSPKKRPSKDITPMGLRNWLISQSSKQDAVKSSMRRRLDLWYNE